MAIRLFRIFTGDDDQSHFSVGEIEWNKTEALNAISKSEQAKTISFEETAAGTSLDWHDAPHRQYVITLNGRLEFESRTGAGQVVEPAISCWLRTRRAEGIAGAWSTINRGDVCTSPYRRLDVASKAEGDQ